MTRSRLSGLVLLSSVMEPVHIAQLYWGHAGNLATGQYFQNMVCGMSVNESLGI